MKSIRFCSRVRSVFNRSRNFLPKYLRLYIECWRKETQNEELEISFLDVGASFKHYFKWRQSLGIDYWEGPLEDRIPWINYSAIDFLHRFSTDIENVFEWGAGGSTLFFIDKGCTVISVEYDKEWYEMLSEVIRKEKTSSAEVIYAPSNDVKESLENFDPSSYDNFCSSDGKVYKGYANSIEKYPDNSFDLVVVDGRARPSCVKKAIPKIKPGKYLLLDNSDRTHYAKAKQELLGQWEERVFTGPRPHLKYFSTATYWRKPSK